MARPPTGRPPAGPQKTKEPWEIDPDSITLGNTLGRGGFGVVYKAKWAGQKVAVKKLLNSQAISPETRNEFITEARLLSVLRHPNIINFFGACVNDPQNMMIVTEYCHGGNLFDYIRNNTLGIERKLEILRDVACGMLYLLNYRNPPILHRDLKSPNVLLARDGSAKLCDFGYARMKTEAMRLSGILGTPQWMSPEILRGELNASEKSDVFSFGVIMWEVCTAKMPWEGVGPHQIVKRVVKGERLPLPVDLDPWFAKLIPRCWQHDPRQRPSFREIQESIQARLDEITGRHSFGPGPNNSFSPADKYNPGQAVWTPTSKSSTPSKPTNPSFSTPMKGSPVQPYVGASSHDTSCLPGLPSLSAGALSGFSLAALCNSACIGVVRERLEDLLGVVDPSNPTSVHSSASSADHLPRDNTQRWIGYTKRQPKLPPPGPPTAR